MRSIWLMILISHRREGSFSARHPCQWVSASAVRSQYGLPQPPERLLFATDSGTCHRVGGNLRLGIVLEDSLFMFIYSSTAAHGPCRVRRVNWIGNFANTDRVNRGDKRPAYALANGCLGARNFLFIVVPGIKTLPPRKTTSLLQSHQDVPLTADRTRPVSAYPLELSSQSADPSSALTNSCSAFPRLRLPVDV